MCAGAFSVLIVPFQSSLLYSVPSVLSMNITNKCIVFREKQNFCCCCFWGGAFFLLNKIEKIFIYFTDLLTHFLFSFQQNLENLKAKSAAGKVEKKEVECGHGNLE